MSKSKKATATKKTGIIPKKTVSPKVLTSSKTRLKGTGGSVLSGG
jgi:hypothetical protein